MDEYNIKTKKHNKFTRIYKTLQWLNNLRRFDIIGAYLESFLHSSCLFIFNYGK